MIPFDAVTLDAAGTLLHPAQPIAEVYAEHATRFGVAVTREAIASRLGAAMRRHRPLRTGDPSWRAYWAAVVASSTGSDAPGLFDALYEHYRRGNAWRVSSGAAACIAALRGQGLRVGLVSNWDVRLHDTLADLGLADGLDAVIVSGEHGCEKPDPRIFALALARLGVAADRWLHVGDDRDDDLTGAIAAGGRAWLVPDDVADFAALRRALIGA